MGSEPAVSTSIHPGKALKAYLKDVGQRGPREGVSRLIERTMERYRQVIATSLPAWTTGEWLVALTVLREYDFWNIASVDVLGLALQQGIERRRAPGLGDSSNFAYRAKTLQFHQRLAVAEVVERYFRSHEVIENACIEDTLAKMGAPIPG